MSHADPSVPDGRPVLVGRVDELSRLDDIAERAVEHGTQMALVSGEAGIGKTTLISECFSRLSEAGWATHVGYCIEFADRPLPFGPIVSILRSVLLDNLDDADDIIGRHRDDLSGLLPELGDGNGVPPSLTGDVDRLFDAISNVLTEAAARRPTAVLVEDIHWADAATRDLITSLLHSLGAARVFVIVTERTGALDRTHPIRQWTAERSRLLNVHTFALSGLDADELAEQAEHVLGERPDTTIIEDLASRTQGNPYFSHELLVARRAGSHALPTSLADFIGSRIDRLDQDEQDVLRALAVAGGQVSHSMLVAMLPDMRIEPLVRRLYDGSIITVEGSEYSFAHALMREAILRDVLPFELESLHRRAAEAIEADPYRGGSVSDLVSLALHWGKANDPDRSLSAAAAGATAAAAVAAYETAAEMALQAIHSWPAARDPELTTAWSRDQLYLQAAEWLSSCYRATESIELIEGALASWAAGLPPGQRALLTVSMAPWQYHLGNPGIAANLLSEGLRLVGDEVSAASAQVYHRLSKQAVADGQIHPALEYAQRAIDIAETEGPEVVLVEATTTKALAVGVTQEPEPGIELARHARELALAGGFVPQVPATHRAEMLILNFQLGRTEACLEACRQGLAYAEQHCGPRIRAELRLDLGLGYVEAGRVNDSGPVMETLLANEHDELRRLTVLQVAGLRSMTAGDLLAADEYLSAATELADRFQSSQETGYQFRLLAEFNRHRGDLEAALDYVDRAIELQLRGDNLTYTRESIVEKARITRALSARSRKLSIDIGPLEKLITSFDGPGGANAAMKSLMELELSVVTETFDNDEALRTAQALDAAGFSYEASQARILLIEQLLAESVSHEWLEEQIRTVWETTSNFGMEWLADRAESLAKAARITLDTDRRPQAPAVKGRAPDALPHDLTAREVEVMSLLAEGLTNKAIGERLYVSPRTVGTHVSNLLAKLGLSNRGEAAAAFHRLGLAETIDLRDPSDVTIT